MATLTIRNVPDDVVDRIKSAAARRGRSMEEEVRRLLAERFAARDATIARIRSRWPDLPRVTSADVDRWIEIGRG